MNKFTLRIPRRLQIFIAFIVVVAGGFLASRLIRGPEGVPVQFTEARLQGALIAQNIVGLSEQAVDDLGVINELDQEGEVGEALDVTSNIVLQSKEIRDQAVALSDQVAKMTLALSDIRSFSVRQAALEAITNQLALINRLVNYSAFLGQLVDALRGRLTGTQSEYNVGDLIEQINKEIGEINNLNIRATQALERFDALVESK